MIFTYKSYKIYPKSHIYKSLPPLLSVIRLVDLYLCMVTQQTARLYLHNTPWDTRTTLLSLQATTVQNAEL